MTAWASFAAGVAPDELEIELLLEAMYQRFGVDFRGYARPALKRRLTELIRAQGLATISALQERMLHQPGALAVLLRALAVPPAALFDPPQHALLLREVLVPALGVCALPRVWLAECAGIGEAWALAILLAETQLHGRTEIFATVSNEELLAESSEGTLPAQNLAALQQRYECSGGRGKLADYLEVSNGRASLLPQLAGRITWAHYSPVTDASFNEFQAIVCWRALPDFGPVLRQRVLRLFHDSLARFGVLGIDKPLSPSDGMADRYQQLVPGQGWYKRVG
ncbi:chemotaxis protein CheR [Massilia terrae]|nr:CheR family methyltransferase [Massilia terrae]